MSVSESLVTSIALRLQSGETDLERGVGEMMLVIDFNRAQVIAGLVKTLKEKFREDGYNVFVMEQEADRLLEDEVLGDTGQISFDEAA